MSPRTGRPRTTGITPTVSIRLGHAKVGITLDLYPHVTQGLQQAAALRSEEGLTAVRETETETTGRRPQRELA